MKRATIYCDGSCSLKKRGGFASILISENRKHIIFGTAKNTTNNRMELIAAIEGLKTLSSPSKIRLFSDSLLLVNTMKGKCKKRHNHDLWDELDQLSSIHKIVWIWIKRNSIRGNREADKIAKQSMRGINEN